MQTKLDKAFKIIVDISNRKVTIPQAISWYVTDENIAHLSCQIIDEVEDSIIDIQSYKLSMRVLTPSKILKEVNYTLSDATNNIFTLTLPDELITEKGRHQCELSIEYLGDKLTSEPFNYNIIQSIANQLDSTISKDSHYPLVLELEDKLKEWNNILDEQVSKVIILDNDVRNAEKTRQEGYTEFKNEWDGIKNTMYESDWYNPNVIKSTLLGEDGIPSNYSQSTYEGFFDWILNPLVKTHPDYITKTILGKDQSGIYNIYRYDFTPKHYDKTILLHACLHGNEYTSFFGLCRFLQELCDDKNANDSNLQYIKNHIKLVVCPILNPWGFINGKRQNVNGVDLNRNFDYRWNEYTTLKSKPGQVYYKGSAPFSEAESINVRDMVYNLNAYNLVACIDFHTITTVEAEKILYYPRFHNNIISELSNVVERFKYGENRAIFASSSVPTLSNYLSWTYKICCTNPEWNNVCHGKDGKRDTTNMTRWVEWAGNLILSMAKNAPNRDVFKGGPFAKQLIFRADESMKSQDSNRIGPDGYNVINSSINLFNTMEPSKYEFEITQQYVIHATGWVKIKAVKDTVLYLQPLLYQQYAPEQNYSTLEKSDINVMILNLEANKEYFIPIDQVIQGYHTNYNTEATSRSAVVHFRFRAYCNTTSSCYINAYNVTIHGTPSDVGEAVNITRITASGHETIFPLRVPEDIED